MSKNRTGRENRMIGGFASLEALSKGNCPDCLNEPADTLKNHSHASCPECMDRQALSPVDSHVLLNKVSGAPRSMHCENCAGTGSIPLYGKKRVDPYAQKGWAVRDIQDGTS